MSHPNPHPTRSRHPRAPLLFPQSEHEIGRAAIAADIDNPGDNQDWKSTPAVRVLVERGASRVPSQCRDASPLGAARRAFTLLLDQTPPLTVDTTCYAALPDGDLQLDELRTQLLNRSCPLSTRDAVWAHLVHCARTSGPDWTTACVGMALPALTALATRLCARVAGDTADVHAEIVRGFLSGLTVIDVDRPAIMIRLRWHAYRAGYAAVGEALATPLPIDMSAPSVTVAGLAPISASASGHPDFVLADAVTANVLTETEADLIGVTRLEMVGLRAWARRNNTTYAAARQARSRAERRLVAWLTNRDNEHDDNAHDQNEHRENEHGSGPAASVSQIRSQHGFLTQTTPPRATTGTAASGAAPVPVGATPGGTSDISEEQKCA